VTAVASAAPDPRAAGRPRPPGWPLAPRLAALAVVLAAAVVAAVRLGAVSLTTTGVLDAIAGRGDPTMVTIVRELRLPRALQAALVGAALAVSGATFQALLRNPLAESSSAPRSR
jgi:iron complex transport system permease protein